MEKLLIPINTKDSLKFGRIAESRDLLHFVIYSGAVTSTSIIFFRSAFDPFPTCTPSPSLTKSLLLNTEFMSSIKLVYRGATRRISLEKDVNHDYAALVATAVELFSIDPAAKIWLEYLDEEADKITVSSHPEFIEALKVMQATSPSVFRFHIHTNERMKEESSAEKTVPIDPSSIKHANVVCDGCGVSPITGTRYKCTGREDFDLCSKCEARVTPQPHPMLKIYTAEQTERLKGGRRGRGGAGGGCGNNYGGREGWGRRMFGRGDWSRADWGKRMDEEFNKVKQVVMDVHPELYEAIKTSISEFHEKACGVTPASAAPATATASDAKREESKEDEVKNAETGDVVMEDFMVWREELVQLADMGFTDAVLLLPLLREHLGAFKAADGVQGGAEGGRNIPSYTREEGLQRVVAAALTKQTK